MSEKLTVEAEASVTLTPKDISEMVARDNGLPNGTNVRWKLISDMKAETFELILFWKAASASKVDK